MKPDRKLLLLAASLGIFVWVSDAIVDYVFFYDQPLMDVLIYAVPPHEIYMRTMGAASCMVLGLAGAMLLIRLRRTQSKLAVKRKLMGEGESLASMGSWHLDTNSDALTWSDEVYRIFGVKPEREAPTYQEFLDRIHPADRLRVDEAFHNAIENHTPYDIVHRIIRPNGETRFVREKSDGTICPKRPGHYYGMVHDITELHAAQQAKESLILELQKSLAEIDTLEGILPICSYCKRICADDGDWMQIELYIHNHTDADFSHGICPDCLEHHFGKRHPHPKPQRTPNSDN